MNLAQPDLAQPDDGGVYYMHHRTIITMHIIQTLFLYRDQPKSVKSKPELKTVSMIIGIHLRYPYPEYLCILLPN